MLRRLAGVGCPWGCGLIFNRLRFWGLKMSGGRTPAGLSVCEGFPDGVGQSSNVVENTGTRSEGGGLNAEVLEHANGEV